MPDPDDLKPCSVQLQRLASVDLPARLDSTSDSVTDESLMEGLEDDSSGSSLPPAFSPSKKKSYIETSTSHSTDIPKSSITIDSKSSDAVIDSSTNETLVPTEQSVKPLVGSEPEVANTMSSDSKPCMPEVGEAKIAVASDAPVVIDKPVTIDTYMSASSTVEPMLVSPNSVSSDQKQNTFQTPVLPSAARPVKAMARKSTGSSNPLIHSQSKPKAFAIKSTGGMFYSSPRSSTGEVTHINSEVPNFKKLYSMAQFCFKNIKQLF